MASGTVKWFNPTKGYGFIQPQGGGKDGFVESRRSRKPVCPPLTRVSRSQYEEVSNRGKTSAENLKVK